MPDKRKKDRTPGRKKDAGERTGADGRALHLAAIAGHQLKSPLSSVQTVLDTVIGGFAGPLTPRQRSLLEKAVQRCGEGIALVSDLMRLRRLDQFQEEDLVSLDLAALFRAALARVRDAAVDADIRLHETVDLEDPGQGWILADAGIVEEILHVLLHNAVKYTPRGGHVDARLYLESPQNLPAELVEGISYLVVEILDTGIGIPPEAFKELFTEFYRAPNAKALDKEGTGLGLSFAARAAGLLGGRVHLEPAEAGGIRAVVRFPQSALSAEEAAELGHRTAREDSGRRRRKISQRVVVIGGVAAGSKAAAKIMRLDPDAEVTVIERGRFLSYAGCGLPYYISGTVRDQSALLSTPLGVVRDSSFFHNLKNVNTLDLTEAVSIDRENKKVLARRLVDGTELSLPYDRLVLATGSVASVPEMSGTSLKGIYSLHGMEDAEAIRAELSSATVQDVVIAGAGLLGCQITESVTMRGQRVTVLETRASILGILDPDVAILLQRHMESHGVKVLTDTPVIGFEGDSRVRAVRLEDGSMVGCDFVILAAGVRPNVKLAEEAGLELGFMGTLKVDRFMRTSDPDIYAAGDCAENRHLVTRQPTWIPLGDNATKQGRVAAINICGGREEYPGVVGSVVLKVFDYTVAKTGLNLREAKEAGFDPVAILVPSLDSAHYIPTSRSIVLKLIADRKSRQVLGAQGLGEGEVAKRIDIIATALSSGAHLEDLCYLDLCYAPPYSLTLDTVLIAANVLRSRLDGDYTTISAVELNRRLRDGDPPFLLDVRLPGEFGTKRLPGSRNVPLGSLRGRRFEVPGDRQIVVICSIGLRGYEASLILKHSGVRDVRILNGGLATWPYELERD